MKRLIISVSARNDLQEIHDYIAKDNADAAVRWIDRLVNRFDVLSAQPGIGRKRDDVKPNYRSIIEKSHVLTKLVQSKSPADKQLADKLVKTAACLMTVTGSHGAFSGK